MMAMAATRFRVRLARKLFWARRLTAWLFLTLRMAASFFVRCCDLAVLNAHDPVGHLGNFFIVGDHHHCLGKAFPGSL